MKKVLITSILLISILMYSCKEKIVDQESNIFTANQTSSCVGCHTDKDLLAEVAEPLEVEGGETGEG